ncbi:MAG TPA: FKBP-type peptidyl-prolyl cis-trans isomerase [Tepidisphaeraceae bacterium]|nr:FKBP-type peptidyl-prolyl cis-trans isomerase [Tepidisphaeraceae bacterium]
MPRMTTKLAVAALVAALGLTAPLIAADEKKDPAKADAKPAEAKPAESKPVKPAETKPEAKPAEVKPAEGKVTEAKPAEGGKTFNTAGGVKVTVTTEAKEAGAQAKDIVWVHYTGRLATGAQFDSSVGQAPFKLTLGEGQVIKGWDEGLVGMKIGEKRRLEIPAAMGYGERGAGDKIPPNSALVFDVEMIGIARPGEQK